VSGFWEGRRVLVTGHTGFKGAWLTLWLHALGARVTGFAAGPPTAPSLFEAARVGELVDDVRGDVRDAGAVRAACERARPELVFHLAAQAIVRAALDDPAGTYAVNVLGTAHVLEAARDAAVVCVTSDKCAYRASFGVNVATARAGNVIGGGDWGRDRLLPDLARARESGAPVVLRHPDAVRPWQHVLDPLAGYLTLGERLHGGSEWAAAWNFGPADAQPVRWVVDRVRRRWPLEVRVVPPADTVEAPALRLDASAARERLGWTPRLDASAAVAATVSWYDQVRAGSDARAVTLTQIEELT